MDTQQNTKKLYRSRTNRVIAGVCGGLGEYFDIDPIIFRIIFIILLVSGGAGFLVYLVLMIAIPEEPLPGQATAASYRAKDFANDVRQGADNIAKEIRHNAQDGRWLSDRRNVVGVIIVIAGALFLLNQLLPFSFLRWNFVWPVILILVGVMIISKQR
jgi:phage shock protein C